MPGYARYHLIFPKVWTALADGRFRSNPRPVEAGASSGPDDVLIARDTGEIRGGTVRESTIFEVFGLPPVTYDLARGGSPVAMVIPEAQIRETVANLACLKGRVTAQADEAIVVIERLTALDCIAVFVAILDAIAALNEADPDAMPILPENVLTQFSVLRLTGIVPAQTYLIDYTNYQGKRSTRQILVRGVSFGTNPYHLSPGLMIDALDVERKVERTFANSGIHAIWEYVEQEGPVDHGDGLVCPRP